MPTIYEYSSTFQQEKPPEKKPGIISRTRFYFRAIRWLWAHRAEPNNRHKWRRMMREVQDGR